MKKTIFYPVLFFFLFILSCDNGESGKITDDILNDGFNEKEFFENIDKEKINSINDIVGGFSSPIEMSAMIKDYHIPFSKKYIISTKKIDSYETNIKKALGLGILSADLGYLNIYEKKTSMIDYLISINELAGDLRVSQFFDFQTLKRLVTTSDNIDSLMFLSVSSYNQIDAYFRQTNRSHLSVLSVTGVWLESLYLVTQVAKDNPYKDFKEQIGSQKDLLMSLYEILKAYEGHPTFDIIIKEFRKLIDIYKDVTITTKQIESRVEIIDDVVIIYPDQETVIDISKETQDKIIKTTNQVRNAVVNIR